MFTQNFSCSMLLVKVVWFGGISSTRLLRCVGSFSNAIRLFRFLPPYRAASRSLAATWEIVVTFFSSGYLDVSVLRVPFFSAVYSQ